MTHLPIFPLLAPLMAAIIILAAYGRPWQARLAQWVALGSLALQLLAALLLVNAVAGGSILSYALGNWPAPFGILLVVDRLAAAMLLVTSLLAPAAMWYVVGKEEQGGAHFHVLFQLQLFGLYGAFLTGDLFNLFVFFEILLLASYGLLLHGGGGERTRAGLHFVVVNLVGSSLFLIAAGLFYGLLGTLNMADIARRITQAGAADEGMLVATGLLLFVVFALKGALLPLHTWLPAAYGHTSPAVAALFAIMTKVGAYAILRTQTLFYGEGAGPLSGLYDPWLTPLALLTLGAGVMGVLASRNLREQAAYLVVVSVGTLLTAFAMGSRDGIAAGLYYLPHSTFAAAALFLLADQIRQRRTGGDRFVVAPPMADARLLGGLFFFVAVLLSGLPPLSGFVGKFLILRAAVEQSYTAWVFGFVLVGGLAVVVALARSGSLLFYNVSSADPASSAPPPAPARLPLLLAGLVPLAWLLLLTIGLLWFASPVYDYALATADQLLNPDAYMNQVLGTPGGRP